MPVRKNVTCSWCGASLNRVVWNYNTNDPIKNFFCDNNCKGSWQKNQREKLGFTREWLISEYIDKEKSAAQIGSEIGRDAKSVWTWIVDYGIETRPRGHNRPPVMFGEDNPIFGKTHTDEVKQKIREARLQDGLVPCMKDGIHWMKHPDYKREDHPNWKGGFTPERQAVYSSQEWCDAVKEVWKRDNAICQRCGKRHNTKTSRGTFHIHHIIGFTVEEFRTDTDNLVLLCQKCHRWVHGKNNKNKDFIKERK